ncbi:hypothetical protein [Actinoplanes subtropicus]|uniref:hypothetical protein n=1 Tax=Actinoplanes subtropicus TaxID=543632 RepID=UPI0012F9344B|nr:hypothetical protein [Actinoplanes subtropicus]
MRTRVALAVVAIGLSGACAGPSAARNEPGQLQFSNSTVSPHTGPVANYREAYDNALRFATIWVRKDIETTEWRSQLAELATSDLQNRIHTDAFTRPVAGSLRGDIGSRVSRPDRIEFVVDTDDGVKAIVMVPENSHWRVDDIQPARP